MQAYNGLISFVCLVQYIIANICATYITCSIQRTMHLQFWGSAINAAAWTLHVIIVRHFIHMYIKFGYLPPKKKPVNC